jgi:hypothetical protein
VLCLRNNRIGSNGIAIGVGVGDEATVCNEAPVPEEGGSFSSSWKPEAAWRRSVDENWLDFYSR